MSSDSRHPVLPRLSESDARALETFCEVVERVRPELDEAVEAAARQIPTFAAILAQMTPDVLEAQSKRSAELQRRALVEGEWSDYLHNLSTQGATYAKMGVGFGDWYALLSPYREVIYRHVVPEELGDAQRTLSGMSRFLDIAMSTIADSYIATKEELIRTAEADRDRYIRDLERSNRELDDFAYVASHDLKAPLRDIDTLAGWIVEDAAESLSDKSKRHLSLLQERIGRMEKLLDDLLSYSRAGRRFEDPEEVEPREVAEDVVALLASPDAFELKVTGNAPAVYMPRAPLEQVLRNLVGNALKHHDRDDGRIEILLDDESPEYIAIAVRDDGPGIAPEFHERVFRMFQSLRPRDEVEGSGMGLAVVKKLVEAHDGRVDLESAPGEGTTVWFSWPKRSSSTR